jgi:putative nucleotidyltransferase with HDIG domain
MFMVTIILPADVQHVLESLRSAGYEAYIVGGCLRDLLLQREPKDWDVTTNALPDQIQSVFQKTFYANQFGTVTVQLPELAVEVTTYRADGAYSDFRHPDAVRFGVSLQEDLARRDFTINALAYDGSTIIDYWQGQADLERSVIRAVGDPTTRFREDALRMLRAMRFTGQLGFHIDASTWQALCQHIDLVKHVSVERIRDELIKLVASEDSLKGIWLLHISGLLQRIVPELEAGVGVEQNLHHVYTVFAHNVFALQFCPSDDWRVRLAALLHDVGKPQAKVGTGKHATFYQHEHIGAKQARTIMKRLAFSNDDIVKVTHLIRHHMFYYNIGEITDAAVRRLVRRVGVNNMADLMAVRVADRLGSGVYKDKPYKLVELERRIEYVQTDPISTSMLAIDGNNLMEKFKLPPGAKVGVLLHRLLDDVLDDPQRNTVEYLEQRAQELFPEVDTLSEADARGIMKTYREALADANAFKG